MKVGLDITVADRHDKVPSDLKKYYENILIPKASGFYSKGVGNMNFYYSSDIILTLFALDTLLRDSLFCAFSIVFAFLILFFRTKSLLITLTFLFSIANTFLFVNFLYVATQGIDHVSVYHLLSFFYLLAISLNNFHYIFTVWKDSIRRSSSPSERPLYKRVQILIREGVRSVFFANFTICLTFVNDLWSKFEIISLISFFCIQLVLINFFVLTASTVLSLVLYEKYYRFKTCLWYSIQGSDSLNKLRVRVMLERRRGQEGFFTTSFLFLVTHRHFRWVILFFVFSMITFIVAYIGPLSSTNLHAGAVSKIFEYTSGP